MVNPKNGAFFSYGDRVRILRHSKYRGEELVGKLGTVRSGYGSSIPVRIDGCFNTRSSYGYYYFTPSELKKINDSTDEIKEEIMPKITNYLNIATVKTRGGRDYRCANFDLDIQPGDIVVFAPFNTPSDLTVAEVVEINDRDDDSRFDSEIVSKVDDSAYRDRRKSRAEAAKLKKEMEARAKQLQDVALYQMLAKDDPDMAALLQKYLELDHK